MISERSRADRNLLRTSILLLSRDQELGRLRKFVLETFGHDITATTSDFVAEAIMNSCAIDLFVLCHTLSPSDKLAWMNRAAVRWPDTRIIALNSKKPRARKKVGRALCGAIDLLKSIDDEVFSAVP